MQSRIPEFPRRRSAEVLAPWRTPTLRVANCLLVIVLMHFASGLAFSQQTHVLLDEGRVLVTRIDLSPAEAYVLTKDQTGAVWSALNPLVLTTTKGGQQIRKRVLAGDAAIVNAGVHIEFRAGSDSPASLIVVKPKMAREDLTVGQFVLDGRIEDASSRNATLLIAIVDCRFRDTWNLGDESERVPSKPEVVVMKAGSVRWIRPGIHHFRNLGSSVARIISVEW